MSGRSGDRTRKAASGPTTPEPHDEAAARMRLWVARARAVGALTGFTIGMLACRRAELPLADATLRSLLAALALALVAWWSTLLVLQALIRTAAVQRHAEIEAALAEAAAAEAERRHEEDEETERRVRRRRGEPEPGPAAQSGPASGEPAGAPG
jgi:signal transduction histidine kinase